MKILFAQTAWAQYLHWQEHDRALVARIHMLLTSIDRDGPGAGIGKPERLRGDLTGFWSRRINQEHRLVYRVSGEILEVAQCRYHYGRR